MFGAFLLSTVAALMVTIWLIPRIGYWLAQPPDISRADAIVVLGSGRQRIKQGISLYNQGLGAELWHTGNVPRRGMTRTYAQFAAELAVERGVPAEAIRLLATNSTWEDGQEIAALAEEQQVQSILVVTEWPHSRRALCVIKRHLADSGIAVYYSPAGNPPVGPENWWQHGDGRAVVLRELIKTCFYWVWYGVVPWRCAL